MSGGPESKKARWSPNSFTGGASATSTGGRADLFANYGYGAQAAINQANTQSQQFSAMNGLTSGVNGLLGGSAAALYSTPGSLSVNTAATGMNGVSAAQMSPSSATSPFSSATQFGTAQQGSQGGQAQQANGAGYVGFGGYGMNGMNGMNGLMSMGTMSGVGLGGMNMLGVGSFPYSPQIGSFPQVNRCPLFSIICVIILTCGSTFLFSRISLLSDSTL